jgi:hypothetical protein
VRKDLFQLITSIRNGRCLQKATLTPKEESIERLTKKTNEHSIDSSEVQSKSLQPNIENVWQIFNMNTEIYMGDVMKKKVFDKASIEPSITAPFDPFCVQPRIPQNMPSATTIRSIAQQTYLYRSSSEEDLVTVAMISALNKNSLRFPQDVLSYPSSQL